MQPPRLPPVSAGAVGSGRDFEGQSTFPKGRENRAGWKVLVFQLAHSFPVPHVCRRYRVQQRGLPLCGSLLIPITSLFF